MTDAEVDSGLRIPNSGPRRGSDSDSSSGGQSRRLVRSISALAVPLIWVVLIVVFGILRPGSFLTGPNFATIFNSSAPLALLAVSVLPTLIVGEFDLSIAAVAGIAGTTTGSLNVFYGTPIWLSVICGIAAGVIIGIVNAMLIVRLGLNTIVVTLGMATLLGGIAVAVAQSQTIGGVDAGFVALMGRAWLGLTMSFYLCIALIVFTGVVFSFTAVGRRMLFVGNGRKVAALAGLKVDRIRAGAFIGAGVLAALSGVIQVGLFGGVQPSTSASLLLPAFSGAFLGTVVISLGRFSAWGTCIAIFFLATGISGLQILGLSGWISDVFYGAALILAIAFSVLTSRKLMGRGLV